MKRFAFAVMLLAACKFGDALGAYCARNGTCECDAGNCCVKVASPCDDSTPCCGAATCVSGQCAMAGSGGGSMGGGAGGAAGGSAGGSAGGTAGGSAGGTAGGSGGAWTGGYDAGLAVPGCVPSAPPDSVANGLPCCRDSECITHQCFGRRPFAVCDTAVSQLGNACGDETDCNQNASLMCDLIHTPATCVNRFTPPLGDGVSCEPQPREMMTNKSCGFLNPDGGGYLGYSCSVPGYIGVPGGPSDPCCYDRFPDGGAADCRAVTLDGGLGTGSCECNDAGGCSTVFGGLTSFTCPL